MLFDGRMHGVEALGKGRATESVQAVVRSDNFDDDQAGAGRLGENGLNVFNLNGHDVSLLVVKIRGYSAHRPAFLSRARRPCRGGQRRLA